MFPWSASAASSKRLVPPRAPLSLSLSCNHFLHLLVIPLPLMLCAARVEGDSLEDLMTMFLNHVKPIPPGSAIEQHFDAIDRCFNKNTLQEVPLLLFLFPPLLAPPPPFSPLHTPRFLLLWRRRSRSGQRECWTVCARARR